MDAKALITMVKQSLTFKTASRNFPSTKLNFIDSWLEERLFLRNDGPSALNHDFRSAIDSKGRAHHQRKILQCLSRWIKKECDNWIFTLSSRWPFFRLNYQQGLDEILGLQSYIIPASFKELVIAVFNQFVLFFAIFVGKWRILHDERRL